jgi:hypothetical protein
MLESLDIYSALNGVITCNIAVGEIKNSESTLDTAKDRLKTRLNLIKWAAQICTSAQDFNLIGRIFIARAEGKDLGGEEFEPDSNFAFYVHLV